VTTIQKGIRGFLLIVPSMTFLLLGATGTAQADINLAVANPSFETLPAAGLPSSCGLGCSYSIAAIPDWTEIGQGGQFQPGFQDGNFTYFNGPSSDGSITVAYSNGGSISQTVAATVQVGATYSLLVDIGSRNDLPDMGGANLLIDGNQYFATGTPAAPGGWTTWTATYTGLAADAGDAITIQLDSAGTQGDFDNVRLTESSTPEPGFYGVLLIGVSGLLGLARMRAKKGIA